MNAHYSDAAIEVAPASGRPETLRLLHMESLQIDRLLSAQRLGKVSMEGLYCARRADSLVGAAWGQEMPGQIAMCWPATIVPGEPERTAERLQRAVDRYLDACHVVLAQAILAEREGVHTLRLRQAGYRQLAQLHYLVSARDQFPAQEPETDLQFHVVAAEDRARLESIIQGTYAGTLDCVEMDGLRAMDDILDGYRQTGVFRPDWWFVATYDHQDVGCLLMADHPEYDQCELVYLGVLPRWRGRGWGGQLTRYAQWIAHCGSRQRLVLAVDAANWPALAGYARAGFESWDQRFVFIRTAS